MARSTGPMRSSRTARGFVRGREGAVTTRGYIEGGPQLAAALERLGHGLRDEMLAQATLAGADVLMETWRSRVPVDDGDYRDSITALASPGRVGATAVVFPGEVPGLDDDEQPRNYASRLEFGTTRRSLRQFKRGVTIGGRTRTAQPSLRPAFDSSKGRMLDAMADELKHLIARATP